MTDFLLGFVLGALLYSALQLTLINDKMDDINEQLYSIRIRLNRKPKEMPSDDEEESTDDT